MSLFYSKLFLFIATSSLLAYSLYYRGAVKNDIIRILIYCTVIQLLAMVRFADISFHRFFLSYGQFVTRLLMAYAIVRILGRQFLVIYENIVYRLIIISIPFYILSFIAPSVFDYFRLFDLNSIPDHREYGGWTVFVYVHNIWSENRFNGFAYEPGGMSMIIIINWIIHILRFKTKIDTRVIIYFITLVLTFSTSGYFALLLILTYYMFNRLRQRNAILGVLISLMVSILVFPIIWRQDFMQGKIEKYMYQHEEIVTEEGGFSNIEKRNVGRISAGYVYFIDALRWPFGHGTTTNGRTINQKGLVVGGANTTFNLLASWGFFGFFWYLWRLSRFKSPHKDSLTMSKYPILLMGAFLAVFATNSMMDAPIFFIFPIYSVSFLNKKQAYE